MIIKVGWLIRSIRKEKNLTLEEFGKLFNPPASRGLVSNWERDCNNPNGQRLSEIASFKNLTIDEFLIEAMRGREQ